EAEPHGATGSAVAGGDGGGGDLERVDDPVAVVELLSVDVGACVCGKTALFEGGAVGEEVTATFRAEGVEHVPGFEGVEVGAAATPLQAVLDLCDQLLGVLRHRGLLG